MTGFFASMAGYGLRLVAGCFLVVLGWWMLPLDQQKAEPDPHQLSRDPGTLAENYNVPAKENRAYRLDYDRDEGFWMITPPGGQATALTALVPGPRGTQVPGDYLEPVALGAVLLSVLRDWNLALEGEDRRDLIGLRLNGQALFRMQDLEALGDTSKAAVPKSLAAQNTSDPVSAPVSSLEGQQPPEVLPSDGPWNWQLPPEINPASPVFADAMAAWRQDLLPGLKAARRNKGDVNLTLTRRGGSGSDGSALDGAGLRITLSVDVRSRINRRDFGNSRKDAGLYLQYQALARGGDLTLDGAFGAGSRKAWRQILQKDGLPADLIRSYDAYLESYVSNELPLLLDPRQKEFSKALSHWAAWVRPRISRRSVEFTSRFQGVSFKLDLGSAASARLLSEDFGSEQRDEVIFLQFLGNFYGTTMAVDGVFGPTSLQSLESAMRHNYRRPEKVETYHKQLQSRYR